MKLINQSHEIWEQDVSGNPIRGIITSLETIKESLLHGIYAQIERAGRVCYKSEDKITEDSAEAFVKRLIDSKHYAMLEHGTVFLFKCYNTKKECLLDDFCKKYSENPYSKVVRVPSDIKKSTGEQFYYVTTNLRVIIENGWEEDLHYLCMPSDYHIKRVTVHLVTNRQVTHELVRHRTMSFAMESTRYCNYSKNRFGSELTFIKPLWLTQDPVLIEDPIYAEASANFVDLLQSTERTYFNLIKANWKPQQAATILPNALKAEIVVTGFVDAWTHLFDLRVKGTTGAPHPQMLEAMKPVYDEFVKRYRIA